MMENNHGKSRHRYFANYYDELGCLGDETITAFDVGAPGIPELKRAAEIMKTATKERLSYECGSDGNIMQYGCSQGHPDFLHALAEFLSLENGERVDSDDLVCISGAMQGLHNLVSLFLQTGDFVFQSELTFPGGIMMFRDLGINTVNIPIDEKGMDVDVLDELLTAYRPRSRHQISDRRPFWAAVYVITSFQNPTGCVLDEERSRKLVKLARKHDVLIIADEVYQLLSYVTRGDSATNDREFVCPKRLFAYDDRDDADYKGNVVSVGSFSKIFAPSTRIGWFELPRRVQDIIRSSVFCGSAGHNAYTSGVMATAIRLGLVTDNLKHLRNLYKKRMDALIGALERKLPPEVKFTKPKGGYHVWIVLPEQYSSSELLDFCKEKFKVAFQLGKAFSPDGKCQNCLRLTIAYLQEEELVNGAERLAEAIKHFFDSAYIK